MLSAFNEQTKECSLNVKEERRNEEKLEKLSYDIFCQLHNKFEI